MEHIILNGSGGDDIKSVGSSLPEDVNASIQEALKAKDKDHREAVKEFGQSCGTQTFLFIKSEKNKRFS